MTREEQIETAVSAARCLFDIGAKQVYVAVLRSSVYVTHDPLDRNVVLAAGTTMEVERASGVIASQLRLV